MGKFIFQQSKLPSFNSTFGRKLAKELYDKKRYFAEGRKEMDSFVRECDDAYLCKRYVPDTGEARLIEDGEFGESDLHDNTNVISIRLALALMPRNDRWLRCTSSGDEDPAVTQAVEDLQIMLHTKAKTRRNVQRFIKQMIVRGSSYLWYDWQDESRMRRMTSAESAPELEKFLVRQGHKKSDAKKFTRGRYEELTFSGPVVTPLDYHDVWVDPNMDIVNPRKPATIVQRFRLKDALLAAVEDDGVTKTYSNLDDVEPYKVQEIYQSIELAGNRQATHRIFGPPPNRYEGGVELVPTYIIHMPYYKLDGYEFWDTYFTIALSSKGGKAHLIKIEENPSDSGIQHLLHDHYIDHFTATPYGIPGLLFQLSKYHQKNFMQLLTVTAAAHSVLPPWKVLESALRNDEEWSIQAGGTIPILDNPLGLDVISPLQMPAAGSQLGLQNLRYFSEEFKASMGVDGLTSDNSARTLTKPKTATEVNRDVTGGSFFLDNAAENMNDVLNILVQGVQEMSQTRLKPNAPNMQYSFDQFVADQYKKVMVDQKAIQAARSITVTGLSGELNKGQDTQNLIQYFGIIGQIADPQVGPIKLFVAEKLANKLNIQIPKELTMDPNQLAATNPQVQQAAIESGLQNPAGLQKVVETIMTNPQLQQAALQMIQAIGQQQAQQAPQGGPPSAPNQQNAAPARVPLGSPGPGR